jgi:hypothetical protein
MKEPATHQNLFQVKERKFLFYMLQLPKTTSEYCFRISFARATTVANNCMVISF